MNIENNEEIIKSRRSAHRYIKREGSPGNYKYWYKMPDGSIKAPDEMQAEGRREHLQRLAEGNHHGHGSMTREEILGMLSHAGTSAAEKHELKKRIHVAMTNARRDKDRGSTFHSHQMEEARHIESSHPRYAEHLAEHASADHSPKRLAPRARAATPATPARSEGAEATAAVREGREVPVDTRTPEQIAHDEETRRIEARVEATRRREAAPARVSDPDMARPSDAITPHEAAQEQRAIEATSPTAPQNLSEIESKADKIARLRRELASGHGVNLGSASQPQAAETAAPVGDSAAAAAKASRSAERIRAASSPTAPAAAAVYEVSPELRTADEPIERMIAEQERGGNPYLSRASEIYHNIQESLKPERREIVRHMLSAIQAVKQAGTGRVMQADLKAKYKELSGKNLTATAMKEFESGTFMTVDEITGNHPIDPEVERMKRGFGAMQFARMKPYLKDSWKTSNPSAPPPFPTFGDVKSWSEHGGVKPEWAGTTRLALPKEVHDAAHKGADGKPKHPPAWMPIQMAPAWKYIMSKSEGDSAYQARNVNIPQGRLNLGNQAQHQEGMVISALRKYVQMRGGADQLTDIPAAKLSEAGLTHRDIYKSEDELSDSALKRLGRHKIIDPIALAPFLDEVIKANKPIKKSWSLVIDAELPKNDFKKSFVVDTKKAELISKIRLLKARL